MLYRYKCKVLKVVDGDTVDAVVDLGFGVTFKARFRVNGIDTPEITKAKDVAERMEGVRFKTVAEHLLMGDEYREDIEIVSYKLGAYGRWGCDIYVMGKDYKEWLRDLS